MSNRRDYYYKQPVTESELDLGFNDCEVADRAMMSDQGLYGIFSGGAPAQHAGSANLTIDVGCPLIGCDGSGQRVCIPGSTLNVNCAQDSDSVSTTVTGVGNEKWVSVFVRFARTLSDPRTDGNSATVYFGRSESYEIVVTQGTEAAAGTPTRPSLDPDAILICDVLRAHSQTQILNANISTTRRQDTFVLAGTPLSIRAGTAHGAVLAMLESLNEHVLGIAGAHPGTAITYAASTAWADSSTIASANVSAAIDEVMSDLGGTSGSARVGAAILLASGGHGYADSTGPAAGTVKSQLQSIVDTIGASTGAAKMGFTPGASAFWADGITTLSAGTVKAALDEIVTLLGASAGSTKIGFDPALLSAVWATGAPLSQVKVGNAIQEIVSTLGQKHAASTGTNGADFIGTSWMSGGNRGTIAGGALSAQITAIKAAIDNIFNARQVSTTPVSISSTTGTAEGLVVVDASGGDKTLNLPAPGPGQRFFVVNKTNANNIILHRNGSEKINNASSDMTCASPEYWVVCDGTDWWTMPRT